MNEVSIHDSYIFGRKTKLKRERERIQRERKIGSNRGQVKGLTRDQRDKNNSW